MKKRLLLFVILGIMDYIEPSAGGGAVASTNEPIENTVNLQIKQQSNDEIAKRWLREGINRSQRNIDLSEYQHPIDWSGFENNGNPYVSLHSTFIEQHYQGVSYFIAKNMKQTFDDDSEDQMINKKLQGYFCLDSSNIKEFKKQLRDHNIITHVSVNAYEILDDRQIRYQIALCNDTYLHNKIICKPFVKPDRILSEMEEIGRELMPPVVYSAIIDACMQKNDFTLIINFRYIETTSHISPMYQIKNIIAVGKDIDVIYKNFLWYNTNLQSIDLSSLSNVKKIEDFFLARCSRLKELYLPPHLTSVENKFLYDCKNLKQLYMSKKTFSALPAELLEPFKSIIIFYDQCDFDTVSDDNDTAAFEKNSYDDEPCCCCNIQ